ncbi:MAG: hypothetical protein DRJ30_02570 [Candidatus Methanomethylicota archaeon]|nr:MAG: hypothetical protein DRJ30_02570 [Candidatus Verstraetearchaeota archaeon]
MVKVKEKRYIEETTYLSILNENIARLISILTIVNPRNVSEIARALGLSTSLTHYYIKKLKKRGFVNVVSKIDDVKIGLRPVRIFINANLSLRKWLLDALCQIPYWRYLSYCIGKFNGIYGQFSIPFGKEIEFQSILDELIDTGLIENYELYWVNRVIYIPRGFHWFNFKSKEWIFRWNDWIKEVYESNPYLVNLVKNINNSNNWVTLDKYDIYILKELEKDAYVSFNEIAKKLNLTAPAVRYHYYHHIIRYKLLSGFRPVIFPYPLSSSDMHLFKISFYDASCLGKFITSLQNKPFASSVTLISRGNDAIVDVYLPKVEFLNFINVLMKLIDREIVKDFFYVTLLLGTYKRQTIPYEQFVDGKWQFEYEKYRRTIAEICKKCEKVRVHQYY